MITTKNMKFMKEGIELSVESDDQKTGTILELMCLPYDFLRALHVLHGEMILVVKSGEGTPYCVFTTVGFRSSPPFRWYSGSKSGCDRSLSDITVGCMGQSIAKRRSSQRIPRSNSGA